MSQAAEICSLIDAVDIDHVGGKALHLGELLRAGFPVPQGFVITTAAYRRGHREALQHAFVSAWKDMGSPRVAVRSSATAEDLEGASMAGQYETYLNVDTQADLIDAVEKCWASVDSPRVRNYLAGQGLTPDQVAMAVVVQRQVPADVAGVLFTSDPQRPDVDEMVVEAAWGLGESVVSGIVQPDHYRINAHTGKLTSLVVADKERWIPSGHAQSVQEVPEQKRRRACLKTHDLQALWKLGKLAATHFGRPQDIEWAIADGELSVLQARAITTLEAHQARRAVLEDVRSQLAGQPGPWVRHNLGETLPHPHPLTWSVIRPFMTGNGGFGAMYRRVGFEPGPAVADDGFLELIAGTIYMDCRRAAEMFFADYPFEYDVELLRTDPEASQQPPSRATGTATDRNRIHRKLIQVGKQIDAAAETLADELRQTVLPQFSQWCAAQKSRSLQQLDDEELIACWLERRQRVFDKLAPDVFLPSLVEGHLQQQLRQKLAEVCWDRDPDELLQRLSVADGLDATMRSNWDLQQVAHQTLSLEEWIQRYGHRCPGEFDLAVPRWRERPEDARKLAEVVKQGGDTRQMHDLRLQQVTAELARIRDTCPSADRRSLPPLVARYREFLPFREDGKDAIIRGCDLLRDVALEIGRRLEIGERVFWLEEQELFEALRTRYVPEDLLTHREHRHHVEATLNLPSVLTADQLDRLGESDTDELPIGDRLPAHPVSRGVAKGTVCIVHSPEEVGELGDNYVLVCPSTDPSWTPLFINAAAVVLERGGSLSHGAVVAREMGVPAVVLPNATRLLTSGEQIAIDSDRGAVIRLTDGPLATSPEDSTANPADRYFAPETIPPPVGTWERKTGTWAVWAAVLWGTFLALVYLLPEPWLHNPLMRGLDGILWPLVNRFGRVGGLALIAAALAGLLMLLQRTITDNPRMLAARNRAARLREMTSSLPPDTPRRQRAEQLAKPVTMRLLASAMVPIALVLGPLCLLFAWFPLRLAPAARNAPEGSTVTLLATVDGEWRQPVRLILDDPRLTRITGDQEQLVPPIRATLEDLHRQWQHETGHNDYPWSIRAAALSARESMLADLNDYLQRGIPPQTLLWGVSAPESGEGSFAFSIQTADQPPVTGHIRIGESIPPVPEYDEILADTAVQKVQIVYPPNPQKAEFWAPLDRLGWHLDFGWLGTYLLAYLPTMFLAKRLLGVA
jgi:pyruvate,water dikinase